MLQLVAALERRDDVARVVVVTQRNSIVAHGVRASAKVEPMRLRAPRRRAELAWRIAWQFFNLAPLTRDSHADVLFSFSGMVPRHPGCPVIALLANPVPYGERSGIPGRLRRGAIRWTLRSAVAAYVPSDGMRRIVALPRLKVVPLGVDHTAFRPRDTPGTDILYVADFYAHKRHDLVLDAWHLLPEPRPRLRLIGNPDVDPATFAAVKGGVTDPRIVVEGRVSFSDLLDAYGAARALVLPSEWESFAMPLAEGLACGVPVVIRDDPVLLETAGPGGLAVAGGAPRDWARTIDHLLRDDALHASLRAAGLEYSKRYSWDAMAAEIVADAAHVARTQHQA